MTRMTYPCPPCPFCGSSLTRATFLTAPSGRPGISHAFCGCSAQGCGRDWWGYWTEYRPADAYPYVRWTLRVSVQIVPWVHTETLADLECYRNRSWDFTPGFSDYGPSCCRWPKSCSAYDGAITTGVGPRRTA